LHVARGCPQRLQQRSAELADGCNHGEQGGGSSTLLLISAADARCWNQPRFVPGLFRQLPRPRNPEPFPRTLTAQQGRSGPWETCVAAGVISHRRQSRPGDDPHGPARPAGRGARLELIGAATAGPPTSRCAAGPLRSIRTYWVCPYSPSEVASRLPDLTRSARYDNEGPAAADTGRAQPSRAAAGERSPRRPDDAAGRLTAEARNAAPPSRSA
ncbi:MAG: hypothetical protein JWO67_6928, partial [Streptosporangiaceae bacterium]|nr:hypothetical protein [Streptosporangiaceae bacterium]